MKGTGYPSPRPLALYYRVRTYLPELAVDGALERFRQQEQSQDQRRSRGDDGIPEPIVNIAGRSHHRERGGGKEPAEPAVADVIGQRHGAVADARRKQFNQQRGNGPVHHRHVQHQNEQDQHDHGFVDGRRIRLVRISGRRQRRLDLRLEGRYRLLAFLAGNGRGIRRRESAGAAADLRDGSRRRIHSLVRNPRLREKTLRNIAGRRIEFILADGIELERALPWIRNHRDGRRGLRFVERRIGVTRERFEERKIGQQRKQAAGQYDGLSADFVRKPAKKYESGSRQCQCDRGQDIRRRAVYAQRLFEKEQRVELSRIPHHGLAHHRAEKCEQHDLEIAPASERLGERGLRRRSLRFHLEEYRTLGQLHAYPQRNGQ